MWASRRSRTRRRSRRSRGVTPTDTISRLCQTPSGSVTSCCGKRVNTRAAAMIVSHVSMCPHLTHSCDTIHIPAALSLPPYQRGDRDYDTNLNPQCKSEEKFSSRSSLVERHQVLSSTGKEVKLFLQVQRRNYWVSSFIRTA